MELLNSTKAFIFIVVLGTFICSCNKESKALEISCQKDVIVGEWDVTNKNTTYFEVLDSTTISSVDFTAIVKSNGTGTFTSNVSDNHFTWSLQCSPNHLLINSLGGPPLEENPDADPMDYIAFSNIYLITNISEDEILMESEYFVGIDETRRRVTTESIYTRIK